MEGECVQMLTMGCLEWCMYERRPRVSKEVCSENAVTAALVTVQQKQQQQQQQEQLWIPEPISGKRRLGAV